MRKLHVLGAPTIVGAVLCSSMACAAASDDVAAQRLQGLLDAITREAAVPAKAVPPATREAPPVSVPKVPVKTDRQAAIRPPKDVPPALPIVEGGPSSTNADALRPILAGSTPSPITGPAPEPTPSTMSAEEIARIHALIEADVAAQQSKQASVEPARARALPLQEARKVPAQRHVPVEQSPAPVVSAPKEGFFGKLFGRKGRPEASSNEPHPNAALVTTDVTLVSPPSNPSAPRIGGAPALVRPAVAPNRNTLENLLGDSRIEAEAAAKASVAEARATRRDAWQGQGPSAYRYQGEWLDGEMHGYGKLQYRDGWEYVGTWNQGTMDGQGRLVQADGSVYEGGWKGGRMHGLGKLTYPDGWTFTGQWKDGRISGQGELVAPGK